MSLALVAAMRRHPLMPIAAAGWAVMRLLRLENCGSGVHDAGLVHRSIDVDALAGLVAVHERKDQGLRPVEAAGHVHVGVIGTHRLAADISRQVGKGGEAVDCASEGAVVAPRAGGAKAGDVQNDQVLLDLA